MVGVSLVTAVSPMVGMVYRHIMLALQFTNATASAMVIGFVFWHNLMFSAMMGVGCQIILV